MQIIHSTKNNLKWLIWLAKLAIVLLAMFFINASCSNPFSLDTAFLTSSDIKNHTLSSESIKLNASSHALNIKNGLVITDNDQAFSEKIRLIKSAKERIDLAYYIYKDDYSSSVLSQELIAAANRGVKVRLLLDYQSTYSDLDVFSMLERYGNEGKGTLEVRFYNRPTLNIIKDAVYLTLGCHAFVKDAQKGKTKKENLRTCSSTKYKEVETRFSDTNSNNTDLLNYNSGGSGLFLSAFYANNIKLMALAIREGQEINVPLLDEQANTEKAKSKLDAATLDKLVNLSKIYIQARHGKGFQRFAAKLKLKLAFAFFGGEINPYYDAFTAYFPVGRDQPRQQSLRDWDYVKDFYHQKLLLVDSNKLILGGRNVEDAYHMHPNPLTEHYVFLDTDVLVEIDHQENSLATSFERIWNYRQMVASISDIRLHAPNDFLVATVKSKEKCKQLAQQQPACEKDIFNKEFNLDYRIKKAYSIMIKKASQFRERYIARQELINPSFSIDPRAEVYYVENLPFKKEQVERQYGAINGKEGRSGKYIHNLWLAALRSTCQQATADNPQNVIMHNAYVFLPSNLLRQLSDMLTGKLYCRHVKITILTNSLDTTDLGIENYAARYSMKALSQYVDKNRDEQRAATLAYYEYQTNKGNNTIRSLHSKVMIFGSDLFIGSANADVRSYMMDANNGLYIRHAPKLLERYTTWFNALLANSKRTKDVSQRLGQLSLQDMLSKDVSKLEEIVSSFAGKNPDQTMANPAIQSQLRKLLKASLEKIHSLSLKSLGGKQDNYEAGEQLNQLFKII